MVFRAVLVHAFVTFQLTVYKVSHGYLQHHHHHWRHHHRRHHNQHDVHQLFQSNSILRVPKTSLSPRHAMPSFSGRDGLPLEDFRWLQLNAKIIRHLSLHSYSLSTFSMIISDDLSRIVSTGAMLLLVAFRSPWARGWRLLPRFQDDVIWTMVTIVC